MSTSNALQKPLSPGRFLLLLCGGCELLPFTREGFGKGYFSVLLVAFVLRSLLLLPFPTVYGYANFQAVVSIALFLQTATRVIRPEWRAVLTQIDQFSPGKPARHMLLLRERSIFFLFLLEPALAAAASWCLLILPSRVQSWTPPFFLVLYSYDQHFAQRPFTMANLPEVLQTYTHWGMEVLRGVNPDSLALLLLVLFPLSVLLNNVAEVRAERVKPPAPPIPESNEPKLTFPTVEASRASAGSGLPSFRAMGEKLRRQK
jgi:hypothetical protein